MGVSFGRPSNKTSKNGDQLILVISPFPEGDAAQDLWALKSLFGDTLKKDGFSAGKRGESWVINYWHEVNEKTYSKVNDQYYWKVELDQRIAKWATRAEKVRALVNEISAED